LFLRFEDVGFVVFHDVIPDYEAVVYVERGHEFGNSRHCDGDSFERVDDWLISGL